MSEPLDPPQRGSSDANATARLNAELDALVALLKTPENAEATARFFAMRARRWGRINVEATQRERRERNGGD